MNMPFFIQLTDLWDNRRSVNLCNVTDIVTNNNGKVSIHFIGEAENCFDPRETYDEVLNIIINERFKWNAGKEPQA